MTTIAYDGKQLCADSLVVSGNLKFGKTSKIIRLDDGSYLAAAGCAWAAQLYADWLNGGDKPDIKDNDEIVAVHLSRDGVVMEYNGIRKFQACVPWAGGSGEHIAITAMYLGKRAREAVEIACVLDSTTDGPIEVVTI